MTELRKATRTIVRFGKVEIAEGIVSANVTQPVNKPASAEVVVSDQVLLGASPDYQSEAQVLMGTTEKLNIVFTGIVDTVEPNDGKTRISMTTITQRLAEQKVGGLSLRRVGALEVMWTTMRSIGYEPEKIEIEGYEPGPLEVFEVAVALDGVKICEPTALGEVSLMSGGTVKRMADGMGPQSLERRFTEGSAWAFTLRTARTLLEAETDGLRAIDTALAWVTTRGQYSGPSLPEGPSRAFRRDWVSARISRRDVAAVRGVSTGRQWLRSPKGIAYTPELALGEVKDLYLPPLSSDLSPQMREALSAWRRAAEEEDPLAAVVALWECIEFYVSGVRTQDIFSRQEQRAVLRKATEGLKGEQLERARTVVGGLNNASLLVRLRAALKQDEVPHMEEEFTLLREVRRLRNDFVHGRSREIPSEVELRYARAIVNRMLVYRVARVCMPTESTVGSGSAVASILRDTF